MATLRERLSSLEAVHAKRSMRGPLDLEIKQAFDRLQQMTWGQWDAGNTVAGPSTAEEDSRSTAELLALMKGRLQLVGLPS